MNFWLGGFLVKNARDIEYENNGDGTHQLWFTTNFVDKNNESHKMRVHIPRLRIDGSPLISMEEVDGKLWEAQTIEE